VSIDQAITSSGRCVGAQSHRPVPPESGPYPPRDGLARAEKIGDDAYIPRFLHTLGWIHVEPEDLDRGLELSQLPVERARKRRHATGVEQTAFTEINRGDAFIAKGDLASVQEVLAEAHRLVKDASVFAWMR
jgi:hypothetical protein